MDPQEHSHHVRPIGFRSDEPVARPIPNSNLVLGNQHAAGDAFADSYAAVLSLTPQAQPLTTDHQPLIDGHGNEWRTFEAAIDTARELARLDSPVLIHCKAGISRSTTVIATALAAEAGTTFQQALDRILQVRPLAVPHPTLHKLGVYYLAAAES